MKHLQQNKFYDCKYSMEWIKKNIKRCWFDENYSDRHEPTIAGASIIVSLPESESFAEFAANDEGWLYVADIGRAKSLPEMSIEEGIKKVETNVAEWELAFHKRELASSGGKYH
jgi:hypothetical protein